MDHIKMTLRSIILKSGSRTFCFALITGLVLSTLCLLFRDALASFVAARLLAHRGFACEQVRVHVPLAFPTSDVELGATRCSAQAGPVQSIEFKQPVHLIFKDAQLELIHCAAVAIEKRAHKAHDVELNTVGDIARLLGFEHPAVELMFDTAVLARENNPPLLIDDATILRGGDVLAELHDMRVVSTVDEVVVTSPRIHLGLAALLGDGSIRISSTATAGTMTLDFPGKMEVKLVVDHLDARKPKADFSTSPDNLPAARQAVAARGQPNAAPSRP